MAKKGTWKTFDNGNYQVNTLSFRIKADNQNYKYILLYPSVDIKE